MPMDYIFCTENMFLCSAEALNSQPSLRSAYTADILATYFLCYQTNTVTYPVYEEDTIRQ